MTLIVDRAIHGHVTVRTSKILVRTPLAPEDISWIW